MVYIIVIAGIIALDIFSKEKVKARLPLNEKKEILPNRFYLWHIQNKGVAYNRFENNQKLVFGLTSSFLAGFLISLLQLLKKPGNLLWKLSFACCLGGGLGNLLDRIKNKAVTDFLYIKTKRAPIFNIADIFVAFGAILCLLASLRED